MLKQELNNIAGYFLLKGGRLVALSSCLVQIVKHVNFKTTDDKVTTDIEHADI